MANPTDEQTGSEKSARLFAISDLDGLITPYLISKIVVDPVTNCWRFTGALNGKGYGRIRTKGRTLMLHKVVYELLVEVVPDDLVCDHRCHDPKVCHLGIKCPHRACINPAHIKLVTDLENSRRSASVYRPRIRTVCANGHPLPPEEGRCKKCKADYLRKYRQEKRASSGMANRLG